MFCRIRLFFNQYDIVILPDKVFGQLKTDAPSAQDYEIHLHQHTGNGQIMSNKNFCGLETLVDPFQVLAGDGVLLVFDQYSFKEGTGFAVLALFQG